MRGLASDTIDGRESPDLGIPLVDDGRRHEVVVTMGRVDATAEPAPSAPSSRG
jgi:hypothetical protein